MGIPDKVLDGINRLEPLPITVQKLLVALNDANINFSSIADTIEYDGAITSNILRTANSAAFGGRARIEHIRDAIVRLGTITLLDIMLIGHMRTMRSDASRFAQSENDLWLHGAAASLAAKAIAKETRNRSIPEASTIAALIHDIGKLILVRYLDASNTDLLALAKEKNLSLIAAEQEAFGCNHAEVGGIIAHKWSFPEAITEAIEHHHDTEPVNPNPMLDTVVLANLTAKTVAPGMGADGTNFPQDAVASSGRIGLTMEGFERVCIQTGVWLQDLKQSYDIHN